MAKTPRQLVIDANIASAAGEKGSGDSKACRDFLEEVRKAGHYIVMTPALADEWKRHESWFTRRWRVAMQQKKRCVFLRVEPDIGIRLHIDESDCLHNDGERDCLRKDCHLVDAALATDNRVASADDHSRKLFAKLCSDYAALGRVIWVNPCKEEEEPVMWLREGAKDEPARCLGYGA